MISRFAAVCFLSGCLTASSCLLGTEEEQQYVEQHRKVVPGNVDQVFDNGYMDGYCSILDPWVYAEDGFYLVDSPDQLDSVFQSINYPGIDTLFPEDGMLLLLHLDHSWEKDLIDYSYSSSGDTVIVDLTVVNNPGPHNPVVWHCVFPIGLTVR